MRKQFALARVRVRQHVNPLSDKYQIPRTPPEWDKVYTHLQHPLHLDIGCGRGRFLLQMAQVQPDWNFLGLEIREPLVTEANQLRDELELKNLHYLFSNVNVDLPQLLQSLPSGVLQYVTIQFPDPWFKKRHAKRRTVQPELVKILAQALPEGGKILLQSDVEAVAIEMRDRFLNCAAFQRLHPEPWLTENPLPIATEREKATQAKGDPVYRSFLEKVK
nr:tRNA (guanosine(46)-N7)-methyltransferase TrmB [Lusitaniella coriacea]